MDTHEKFARFFEDEKIRPFIYLLSKKMTEGHICLYTNDEGNLDELIGTSYEKATLDNSFLNNSSDLVSTNRNDNRPFIYDNDRLYLNRYFTYETNIIDRLASSLKLSDEELAQRTDFLNLSKEFIKKLALNDNIASYLPEEKPDWQLIAALQAFINNFTIITGGPGTGKTTTVAKVLSLLFKSNPNLKVALAAPTGKAAMRMKESLEGNKNIQAWEIESIIKDIEPSTIHRLLGVIKDSHRFKKNKHNSLDYDVVIIDEASMIGAALFSKLLDAIDHRKTRLLLLGDANQLASVDAGSLFGDICLTQQHEFNKLSTQKVNFLNSFLNEQHKIDASMFTEKSDNNIFGGHIIELKKTYRYDVHSKMGRFTKHIIKGELDELTEVLADEEISLLYDPTYDSDIFNAIVMHYTNYIEEEDTVKAIQKLNNVRVLCAVKQSKQGVYHTNERIEKILEKHYAKKVANSKLFKPSSDYYHNQAIMVTKNYPDLELFNGDVGIIRKDDDKLKAFFLDKNGALRSISPGFISECETVFAMTIHKSQGSEFGKVLIILPKKAEIKILTRELLYTAVTRAKTDPNKIETVAILQGPKQVLDAATKRNVSRASGLTKRLLNLKKL
jgi:exodeoxyribonuclease V alpha subunit